MRILRDALACCLVIVAGSAQGQELQAPTLTKLKEATAYVKWSNGSVLKMGSAFLVRKSADTGWFLTCAHVVAGAPKVEVVLLSGSGKERVLQAEVLAADETRDVAFLRVKDSALPAVLEFASKTELRETENVFVAGFPFGEALSTSSRNPDISISKVSVSSIRRDERGEVATVQLDGNVNPGNSGGPVVDSKGKIVGMAAAKIAGTGLNFAIPPESLKAYMRGRVVAAAVTAAIVEARKARLEIRASLLDPLGSLKSVGFAWIRRSQLKGAKPTAGADGRWKQASPLMKEQGLKKAAGADSAEATVDIGRTADDTDTIEILFQIHWMLEDGSVEWTEPEVRTIDFTAPPAPAGPKAPPPDKPVPPAAVGAELVTGNEVVEKGRLHLMTAVGELMISADGAFLYALDLSDSRLLKISTADMTIAAELKFEEPAICASLSAKGDTIYVASQVEPAADEGGVRGRGRITAVSTATWKPGPPFDFEGDPRDIEVSSAGLAVVQVEAQLGNMLVIDLQKRAVEKLEYYSGRHHLRLHPDQSRIYIAQLGSSGGSMQCLIFQRDPKLGWQQYASRCNEVNLEGAFEISPDGRYLMTSTGGILRLAKTAEADMAFVSKTDPWISAAMAPGCGTFYLATEAGFLKEYALSTLELRKSIRIEGRATHLVLDPARKMLFAHLSVSPPESPAGRNYPGYRLLLAGDLVALSLEKK